VHSSPAVANGYVYVGSYDNRTYCLDATTGALVWSYATGSPIWQSSPAVSDGYVYIGSSDRNVYCLNATTGAKVWAYKTYNFISSSPAIANGYIYIGSWDQRVYCLNATDGRQVWNYSTNDVIVSSPAIANGYIYIGSGDHNLYCLNATTGAKVWNYTTGASVHSSPAVANGYVYVGSYDNRTYCLDATTGAHVWNYTTGGNVVSSPAICNGIVYIGSVDGKLYAFGVAPPLDITPPLISNLAPANGSSVSSGSVSISASYTDNIAIDLSSIALKVDGVLVTSGCNATSIYITYSTTMQPGSHDIELTVKDTQGNSRTATWAFSVTSPVPPFPWEYVAIGIVAVVAIAASVIFLRRRKLF